MRNVERKLYQKNKLGYSFILFFIALNVVYSIFMLNNMETNAQLGIFIFITILFFLLGFLTGIKIQAYSKPWSYVAIIMGLIQFSRMFVGEYILEANQLFILNIVLIASALSCITAGVVGYINTVKRENYIENDEEFKKTLNH